MSEPHFASLSPTLLARKGGAKPAMRPQLAPLPENFGEGVDEDTLEDLGWNDMGSDESGAEQVAAIDFASPGDELIVDPLHGARVVSIGSRQPLDLTPAMPRAANEDTPSTVSPLVRHQDKNPTRSVLADAVMEPQGGCAADEDESLIDAPQVLLQRKPAPAPAAAPAPAPKPANARRALASDRSRAVDRRAAFTLRLDPDRHLKLRLVSTMQGVSAQALLTEALDAMLAEFEELDALAARFKRH